MAENTEFPIANPTIEAVFEQFLDDVRQNRKPTTVRKYESIINLFGHCLNSYAYQGLSKEEAKLFDTFYNTEGDGHRDFVQIFGPEKIPENIGEFLGYFMPHKVICGKETLKSAGTVIKKLGKWLTEHDYAPAESGTSMAEAGAEASAELPAAQELTEMLMDYADSRPAANWTEQVEDHFVIASVESGGIYLESIFDVAGEAIYLQLPKRITDKCKTDWQVFMALGKTKKGWQVMEVGQVYP